MEFDLENPLPPSKDRLHFLFTIENDHMPSLDYIYSLNSADGSIRRLAISSIWNVSCNFDPSVSYLAITYADRFLSVHSFPEGKTWIFKIVAVSCVSLALKMMNADISVSDLIDGSGIEVNSVTIGRTEMLILGALKWRMRSVTPFAFVNYFTSLFIKCKGKPSSIPALKNRASEVIIDAHNEIKLLEFKPSVISASAILCAADKLFPAQQQISADTMCISCSYLDKDKLLNCYDLMQASMGYYTNSTTGKHVTDLQCLNSTIFISQHDLAKKNVARENEVSRVKHEAGGDYATGESSITTSG